MCWDTAGTRQCYLFAVFLLPHSTTEQVSLKKCPPPPPCVRAEIRHWRDQQTEEAKTNRGNCLGSDRCSRLKPCSYHWLHRKGPIDLEKHKLDRGTIWKWTNPTLSTTTPEKVLDIFLLLSFFKKIFLYIQILYYYFNFNFYNLLLLWKKKETLFFKANFIYIYYNFYDFFSL